MTFLHSLPYLILLVSFTARSQEIALTFDDAPTADGRIYSGLERTQRIVHTLKKHRIEEVAFFVITGNIDAEGQSRLKTYSAAGHLLANHSHKHLSIHQAGTRAYIADIKTADSILCLLGGYTKWFRYPFLDEGRFPGARDSIRFALEDLNLTNGYVTVDNYDWYLNHLLATAKGEKKTIDMDVMRDIYINHIYSSIQFYDQVAQTHLGRSPKHVLLLHENDLAALFLDDLIASLKTKGWKIISPRDAYRDPIANQIPDVLFNGQGRVAAIARAKGVPARDLVQHSEDEVYLDELVKSRKVFR